METPNNTLKQKLSFNSMRYVIRMLTPILNEKEVFKKLLDKYTSAENDPALRWYECYNYHPLHLVAVALVTTIICRTNQSINIATKAKAAGIYLALSYNLECLGRHGVHIYDLLEAGKKGNDKAILDAIKIDPSVAALDFIVNRKIRSQLSSDLFDKKYIKALSPSKKHDPKRKFIRLFINLLYENGQLGDYSDMELSNLFEKLNVISIDAGNYDNIRTLKANTLKAIRTQNSFLELHPTA